MSLPTPEDTRENVPLYHQGNKRKVKSEESSGKRLARQGSSKPTRLSFLSLWLMGSLSPLARQGRWKKKNPAAAAAGWWVLTSLSLSPFLAKLMQSVVADMVCCWFTAGHCLYLSAHDSHFHYTFNFASVDFFWIFVLQWVDNFTSLNVYTFVWLRRSFMVEWW